MRFVAVLALLALPSAAWAQGASVRLRATSAAPVFRAAFQPVLASAAGTLAPCAPASGAAFGEIVATLEVATGGGHPRVEVERTDTLDRACVEAALAALDFPTRPRGNGRFVVWWSFRPGSPLERVTRRHSVHESVPGEGESHFSYIVTIGAWLDRTSGEVRAWLEAMTLGIAQCNPFFGAAATLVAETDARGLLRIVQSFAPANGEGMRACIEGAIRRVPPRRIGRGRITLDLDVESRGGESIAY